MDSIAKQIIMSSDLTQTALEEYIPVVRPKALRDMCKLTLVVTEENALLAGRLAERCDIENVLALPSGSMREGSWALFGFNAVYSNGA